MRKVYNLNFAHAQRQYDLKCTHAQRVQPKFFCMRREYNLIGVLMGLAVYNSIILDLHFPAICYRKLLTPPVVPPQVR